MIKRILLFDWQFWFLWIMASTWGWLVGSLILPELALVIAGIFMGVFQWLVLQGRLTRPWHWIPATGAGWLLGYLITLFTLPQSFEGLVIGLTTGTAQWLILRRQLHWAGWWIIFSLMGWVSGLTLFPGLFLTGTMAGALTGLCLEVLLRYPKPRTTVASPSL